MVHSEQEPKTGQKKEEKDTSFFRGKPFVRGADLRSWAEGDIAYKATDLPVEERKRITQELFGGEDFLRPEEVREKLTSLREKHLQAGTGKEREELKKRIKIAESILAK